MLNQRIRCLAGKTDPADSGKWLPLWVHMADTAYIMERLARFWLPEAVRRTIGLEVPQLLQTSRFLGAIHDIGKATCLFQHNIMRRLPEAADRLESHVPLIGTVFINPGETQHAKAGEAILLYMHCPGGFASVAGAHHGKTQEWDVEDQIDFFSKNYWGDRAESWKDIWKELLEWALEESGIEAVEDLPQISVPAQILLTGLLTMADWIASNTKYFPTLRQEDLGSPEMYPARVDAAWEALSLTEPWEPQFFALDDAAFEKEFGFLPNSVQKAFLRAAGRSNRPGIYILEAHMGSGKTEAALAAAELIAYRMGSGGIFFGLPTQATSNGIFGRLETWAEKQSEETVHSIRLAHGMAMLNEDFCSLSPEGMLPIDEEGGVLVHSWFTGHKQALLADFVIGTVDQLLMAALRQKHVMLRHLGLAGKVVIIDECHAYDAYMNGYLDMALRWLGAYRVPVILLSATLPGERREALIAAYQNRYGKRTSEAWELNRGYPLLTSWTEDGGIKQEIIPTEKKSTVVRITTLTEKDLPGILAEKLQCGGCAGIIVNTVKKAQKIAETLRETLPDVEIFLFHAQFVMPDRAEKEKILLRRIGKHSTLAERSRFLVIGTQVLEQSLDIDFDYLITELCPMDLLLQRIGRLHRHDWRERPLPLQNACCAVLDTGDDSFDAGSRAIYTEWLLWRTRKLLPRQIKLPQDIPELVQGVYGWNADDAIPGEPGSDILLEEYENLQKIRRQRSKAYQIIPPDPAEDLDSEELETEPQTLDGWMTQTQVDTEGSARSAVRDGDPSVEVLVMFQRKDGTIHFLPWQEGGAAVSADRPPSAEESLKIARQRLRLPGYFSRKWRIDRILCELEEQNREKLPQWQQAPMLKGELVLLLDEDLSVGLSGTRLYYDRQTGLTYEREEDDAGEGI